MYECCSIDAKLAILLEGLRSIGSICFIKWSYDPKQVQAVATAAIFRQPHLL